MNIGIALLVFGFFITLLCVIRSLVVYYDFNEYLSSELFRVKWDSEKCIFYLQVKRKWSLIYRTCYWKIGDHNNTEYYRIQSTNSNDLYSIAADSKNYIVVFTYHGFVPIKSKNNEKERY